VDLLDYISTERLKIYSDILKIKPDDAIGGYNWNKSLSSAMQPLMHCLEITLRNSIDYAIRNNPPPGAIGLWHTDKRWIFDLPRYIGDRAFIRQGKRYKYDSQGRPLNGKQGTSLKYDKRVWEETCTHKVGKRITNEGKTKTPERIIAGLDFGFWTNILNDTYEEPRTNKLLWPHLLPYVFPHAPPGTKRHEIARKFERIRILRNRLAHHEAIWKFQYENVNGKPDYSNPVYGLTASLSLLTRSWKDMLEALYWISPNRHSSFLAEGHHLRFEALATTDGLSSFISSSQISEKVNVRRSIRHLLRGIEQNKIIRITNSDQTLAVIGPDFVRL